MKKMLLQIPFLFLITSVFSGPVAKLQIGTTHSLLNQLPKTGVLKDYTYPTTTGEQIPLKVKDYYYENGNLSMSGAVSGSEESKFILKGNGDRLYGWVIHKQQNTAFKYLSDESGNVFVEQVPITHIQPVCDFTYHEPPGAPKNRHHAREPSAGLEPHTKLYAGEDLFKLQSLPGSGKVMWLDISRVMDGNSPRYITKEEMYKTWQVFASSFSMFDINVTTDESVYESVSVNNSGINRFVDETGTSNCNIGSFGTTTHCFTRVGNNSPEDHYIYGKTAVHEAGHMMGLQHDGSPSNDYFGGLRDYEWSPIMGNNLCCESWPEHLHQWSKGEYANANQQQDDLVIITRELNYKQDDIPNTVPLNIGGAGVIDPLLNRGQINTNTDSDRFSFQIITAGGNANLDIFITELRGGSALDIDAQIVNASTGQVMGQDNPEQVRSAALDIDLPVGIYELVITGGAEGTPLDGFSNYATMGYYAVSGEIMGAGSINNKITYDGSGTLCQGQSTLLSAHNDPTYTYQWFRNNTMIAGANSVTFAATQNGIYHVLVGDGENQINSPPVELETVSVPAAPVNNTACSDAGTITLRATGTSDVLNWYATQTSEQVLHTGTSYEVDLNIGTSYFVSQKAEYDPVFVGPQDNTFGSGGYHAGDYYQIFDAEANLEIKSATVYAQGSKTRNFVLYNSSDQLIASKEIMVTDGESRVTLDFSVPAGTDYKIGIDKINDQDVDMYRNDNGPDYPYTIGGLVSIKGSTAGNNSSDYYYYLYDWTVQKENLCSSLRTEVKIQSCLAATLLRDADSRIIYTFANNKIFIQVPQNIEFENISLISTDGSVMMSTRAGSTLIDISNYTSGIYILKIAAGPYSILQKIVKQ